MEETSSIGGGKEKKPTGRRENGEGAAIFPWRRIHPLGISNASHTGGD